MASLADIRTKGEAQLGRKLRSLNAKHRKRVAAAIEEYGGVSSIPVSFWAELQREIEEEVALILILIYVAAHESTQNKLKFNVPSDTVQQSGRQFAVDRAATLAKDYTNHTKERLEAAQASIPKADKKGMQTAVNTTLNKERADGAAVTETTTAISGGQGKASDDFETEHPGEEPEVLWYTEADGRVCIICRPLHQTKRKSWVSRFPNGPPAHPNCRCELKISRNLKLVKARP